MNIKKAFAVLFVFIMSIVTYGYSQTKTITGTIISSEDKEPLPGVGIRVKGSKGKTTDINGAYSIEVPNDAKSLNFSMTGFLDQDVEIGSNTVINVTLMPDNKMLEEVVVMGYTVQRKKDVTSAVSTIKGSDLTDLTVQSFDQGLSGRAPGLNVTIPNGVLNNPPVIRIRGFNSINNSSTPLVIIRWCAYFYWKHK